MFLIPITIFFLVFYQNVLQFPFQLNGVNLILAFDLLSPFLLYWAIYSNIKFRYKVAVVFITGLIIDILLASGGYVQTPLLLIALVYINNNKQVLRTDGFIRSVLVISFMFVSVTLKAVILSIFLNGNFIFIISYKVFTQIIPSLIFAFIFVRIIVKLLIFISENES